MKKSISIIGSGPASIMLACTLDETLYDVTVYERKPAPARKFLVAGHGGLNITHSEPIEQFISRYTPSSFLEPCLRMFSNTHLQDWLRTLGIETYTGSSKRVYPVKGIKPIEVLNTLLHEMKRKNVQLKTGYTWMGWNEKNELLFRHGKQEETVQSDITVFALGGGSWSKTGSDGSWTTLFQNRGIDIVPFQASNAACLVNWDELFLRLAEGKPLKNCSVTCSAMQKKGELVITRRGLEGGCIYALNPEIRRELNEQQEATVLIDLKPDLSAESITRQLMQPGAKNITDALQKRLKLNPLHIALLKSLLTKEEFMNLQVLSEKIKRLPVSITGLAPLDESISTTGGIALHEVDENFHLKKMPGCYAIGEMLDWDAPTGGYLLQACFSMGYYLGTKLNTLHSNTTNEK